MFVGNGGLRAGWSALIFLGIFAGLVFISALPFFSFIHFQVKRGEPQPAYVAMVQEGVSAALVLVATWIMSRIEKRSFRVYGYAGKAKVMRFAWGCVWGFGAISGLVLALWKWHLLAFDGSPLTGPATWKFAAEWALAFFFIGIFEESLLRGYLQYTLARGLGFWWGALILSALFGGIHSVNAGESPVGLFAAAAIGLVLCLSLWYTGSLWWAIGFHAAWDWGETYFYGTANSGMAAAGHLFSEHPSGPLLWSGGATGPEGSLLVLPLILIAALLMWLWWGRRVVSPFAGSGWRPAPENREQGLGNREQGSGISGPAADEFMEIER
ncbi:MAG: CPBP family intramembrane metalloprotease [Silvibacterium sp.]|nr:CPBP family intramembrane metalloprotease [Silvibacterium sp.]